MGLQNTSNRLDSKRKLLRYPRPFSGRHEIALQLVPIRVAQHARIA
jgi:hypothetical protein